MFLCAVVGDRDVPHISNPETARMVRDQLCHQGMQYGVANQVQAVDKINSFREHRDK